MCVCVCVFNLVMRVCAATAKQMGFSVAQDLDRNDWQGGGEIKDEREGERETYCSLI